jgi:hypothetical protein
MRRSVLPVPAACNTTFAGPSRHEEETPMQPDRYTKAALTVIAAALVWQCTRDIVTPAPAQAGSGQPVVIEGGDRIAGSRFDPLPVTGK